MSPNSAPDSLTANHDKAPDKLVFAGWAAIEVEVRTKMVLEAAAPMAVVLLDVAVVGI